MTHNIFKFSLPFIQKTQKNTISVVCLDSSDFSSWLKKQPPLVQAQITQAGFEAKSQQICAISNKDGEVETLLAGLSSPVHYLDTAAIVTYIQSHYATDFIKARVFEIVTTHEEDVANKIALGWGLGCYKFSAYKDSKTECPSLLWPKNANKEEVNATVEATFILRNLINIPANDLGTDDLADAAKDIAKKFKADIKTIKGDKLEAKNFPLIHAVGRASVREPQLVDLSWGSKKHPKVTLVGKGIVYDTGGLDIKPNSNMFYMKKDMGGAAHVLAVAYMIMALKLPVCLRVLLPIAENAVSGNSYRPGDIIKSRKGLTVEIINTDAEGRLVLADALSYACEEKPDLLVDFATLTGGIAVGHEMPSYYTNKDDIRADLQPLSADIDDDLWPMPLFKGYEKNIDGTISDIKSVGSGRAGHVEAALILQRFITADVPWVHLDIFGWEQKGRPGRPVGAGDMGMRAIFNLIRDRYA